MEVASVCASGQNTATAAAALLVRVSRQRLTQVVPVALGNQETPRDTYLLS